MNKAVIIYIAVINIITFFIFGIDKWKAVHNRWRIREAFLFGLSIVGGSIGGLLAMNIFHHKTQKPAFKFGMPAILILQIIIIYFLHIYLSK